MGEYEEEQIEQKLSKYNSGVAQLYRIDAIWKDCNKLSCAGRLEQWNWKLDAMWRELAADLASDSKDVIEFNNINLEFIKLLIDLKQRKFRVEEFREKQYQVFQKKELFLRRLQNKLGKGSAYEDQDEDDFE